MNFVDAFFGAPGWVWALLLYLVFIGIKSLREQQVFLPLLGIMPALFIFLKLGTAFVTATSIAVTIWGLAVGYAVGSVLARRAGVKVDKKTWIVTIPGSPVMLIVLLTVFTGKFVLGYLRATNIENDHLYSLIDLAISMLLVGYFLGRATAFARELQRKTCC